MIELFPQPTTNKSTTFMPLLFSWLVIDLADKSPTKRLQLWVAQEQDKIVKDNYFRLHTICSYLKSCDPSQMSTREQGMTHTQQYQRR